MDQQTTAVVDRLTQAVAAFVIPGGVLLFGVASTNPVVAAWFVGAQSQPTLAGFGFVLLGALALGFVVTAVRFLIFERIRWFGHAQLVPAPAPISESVRSRHAGTCAQLRRDHYDHYLAYANLAVAIPAAAAWWLVGTSSHVTWWQVGGLAVFAVGAAVALGVAAVDCVQRYAVRRAELELVQPTNVA